MSSKEEEAKGTVDEIKNGGVDEKKNGDVIKDENEGKLSLERRVTLLSGVALLVGSMIGSGIFVSPVGVLRKTQSVGMSLIIWVLCGALSTIGALCYAELGTLIPKSGGEFSYLYHTYGPMFGYLYAWVSTILIKPSSLSIISLTFAEYAVQPIYQDGDCDPPPVVLKMVAGLCVIIIGFVNCASVKWATSVQNVFTAAKLLALFIIFMVGLVELCKGSNEYLDPRVSFKNSSSQFFAYGIAFYQGLWAYDGWNQLNYITEELKNPYKNLPRAIIIAIPTVTVVYLLVNMAYFTVMSPEEMLSSPAVAVTFAYRTLGPVAVIIPIFVCCSTFGAANGTLFTAGRLAFVAGREGHTLSILSMVHVKRITPMPALMFNCIFAIAMLIPNDFDTLVNYFSFASWMFYGLTSAAVMVLRFREPEKSWPRPIKVPLVLPVIMVIASVYLVIAPIIDEPALQYLYAFIFILAGLVFYIPFVRKGYHPKFMNYITLFLQQLLEVAPSYYAAVEMEDDEKVTS